MTRSQRYGRPSLNIDYLLVLATIGLLISGLMSLYSISVAHDAPYFRKQVQNLVIGIGPFLLFLLVPARAWMRLAWPIYLFNIGLLFLVLVRGVHQMGAQRWINIAGIQFQPSEMAKILVVITLASFYANRQDRIREFSTFVLGGLHVIPAMLLIFKQPHLGATFIILAIWFCISLVAEVPLRYLLGTFAIAAVLGGAVYKIHPEWILKDYQMDRVKGLVNKDAKEGGYHTLRAEIAIGSGGVLGQGYLRGEQKEAGFIPEQHNDFVFTVVGEEGGLIGATMVLGLFATLLFRMWLVMLHAADPYYRMLVAGVLGIIATHFVVNLSMILQIIPVVGLWLPFMSSGGTALWLCLSCVALVLNIRGKQQPVLFD